MHYENQHLDDEKLYDFSVKIGKCTFGQLGTTGMSGEDYFRDPAKITLNNQTFLFCQKTRNDIIYKWVYILGSPIEAKHFSYTLKLIGRETKSFFEGKVATIDEPFDTLFKAGKCFAIPHEAFIAQFVDENKYEYSLEIRNLKEEVKDENYESGISDNDEDSKE